MLKFSLYSKDFSPNNWDGVCSDFISDTLLKSNIEEYKKEPLAYTMALYVLNPVSALNYMFSVASCLMYGEEDLSNEEYLYTFYFIKGRIIKLKNNKKLKFRVPLFKSKEDLQKVCSYYRALLQFYKYDIKEECNDKSSEKTDSTSNQDMSKLIEILKSIMEPINQTK